MPAKQNDIKRNVEEDIKELQGIARRVLSGDLALERARLAIKAHNSKYNSRMSDLKAAALIMEYLPNADFKDLLPL